MDDLQNSGNNTENENEEFSTVFSTPQAHTEKVKTTNYKKRRFSVSLALLLCVAVIIGGTVAVIKMIPEKEDDKKTVKNRIEIFDYSDHEIETVTLKNKNGTFEFYSKSVEATDDATDETLSDTFWYMKGYDTDLTDSDLIKSVVVSAVSIDAIREIDSKSEAECGLKNPTATAKFVTSDKKKITVFVGKNSPDNAGVYIKVSTDNKIYLVGEFLNEKFTFTALDLASQEAQNPLTLSKKYKTYLSNDTVSIFDKLVVSSKKLPQDLVFQRNEDELLSGYIPYYIVSPVKRDAANVDSVFSIFSQGFAVTGAYSYDVKPETVKKFNLDKPDFEAKMYIKDYTYSYKFKKQKDGDYAVLGTDSKNIKKVSIDGCAFLDYSTTDFYSQTVFITPIDAISNLKIETDGKVYDFSITSKKDADDTKKYTVECGGKTYNSTYFSSFYAFLSSLQNMGFDVDKVGSKPDLKMTYTYKDKSLKPTTIEYFKVNATKYQYSIDGVAMGKIGSASFSKIGKNLERLLEGKQVIVN